MRLVYLIDIVEGNHKIVRDRLDKDSLNVMKNRPLVAKKLKGNLNISQQAITCSKLIIETLEQGVEYVQS